MLFCPCQTKAIPSCCQALYYSSCTLYNLLSLFLHNLSSGICSRTVSPSFPDIVPLVHLPPPPYSFSYILTLLCHSFPVYSNSCMALLKLNSTKPGRFVGKGIKDVHILRHGTVTDSVFVLLCITGFSMLNPLVIVPWDLEWSCKLLCSPYWESLSCQNFTCGMKSKSVSCKLFLKSAFKCLSSCPFCSPSLA